MTDTTIECEVVGHFNYEDKVIVRGRITGIRKGTYDDYNHSQKKILTIEIDDVERDV